MKQKITVTNEMDRMRLIDFVTTLDISKPWEFVAGPKGTSRSDSQNRLQQEWNKIISDQKDDSTFEEIRAFNKLHFGIPILRMDERFAAKYDEHFKTLTYERKLEIVQMFDIPVTRLMTVKQKTEYLGAMAQYWAKNGIFLPFPEDAHIK